MHDHQIPMRLLLDIGDAISQSETTADVLRLGVKALALAVMNHGDQFAEVLSHGITAGCVDVSTCADHERADKIKALCALLFAYVNRDCIVIHRRVDDPSQN